MWWGALEELDMASSAHARRDEWWRGPCTHFLLGSLGDATDCPGVVSERRTQGAGGDRH